MSKAKEIMAKMEFKGGRKQVDKPVEQMTAEERAVFDAIDGDEINDFRKPGFEVTGDV